MINSKKNKLFFILIFISSQAYCGVYFDPSSLAINGKRPENVDLTIFEQGGQLPGTYKVKIYLNETFLDERDVSFILMEDKLVPEFSKEDYKTMGVDIEKISGMQRYNSFEIIKDTEEVIPQWSYTYNFNRQRLDIQIPQAYILFTPDDYVSPTLWDQGITAAFSTYDINYNHSSRNSAKEDDLYLNFNNGINVGGWRFRNNAIYTKKSSNSNHWQNLSTYLEHDISFLRSQFIAGQTYTSGELFTSFGFTGIRLYSDDNMLPYSRQGLSPAIKGIAQSQAMVIIKQNGYVIKQVSVPPGPFSIENINAINNGTLEVTIRESNGREHSFIQPWSSVPGMQRAGHLRYAFEMGKYRSPERSTVESNFLQAQMQYGFNNQFTAYTGTQLANDYQSAQIGVAHSLGIFGALSLDATLARANLSRRGYENHEQGESYRLQYAKFLDSSNTNISIAGYRFSTKGYYEFPEYNEFDPTRINSRANKKSRIQVLVYQSLNEYGSLLFNAYRQNYWQRKGNDDTYSLGYSFNLWDSSFNVNLINAKYNNTNDKQIAFNVTVPFSAFSTRHWINYGISTSNKQTTNNVSLFGNVGDDYRWNYNIRKNITNKGGTQSYSLGTLYKGNAGNIGVSFYDDQYSDQFSLAARGAVLAHPWGVTFANQINDTAVLVRAPGAANTKITGINALTTDHWGYAVITNVDAYHRNKIGLDSSTLPNNVDADAVVKVIVPTRGAIGVAEFKTVEGHQALINISHNGNNLAFGTLVSLVGDNDITGIVDDKGIVYMHGLPNSGTIIAKWGVDIASSCKASFSLKDSKDNGLQQVKVNCK